jgi:non-lysosomal glucosylceramidase
MPATPSPDPLFARGEQRTFTGASLREIAFPLGGIGTGTVSLGGRGQLRDWEIFNRPGKGKILPYTFFALWAQPEGGQPIARVLERRLLPPYVDGAGLPVATVSGLPRLKEARFRGEYPFAWIEFEDDALPLSVRLEAFNPFIPGDAEASGQPVAVFRWTLRNEGRSPVDATVALSLLNAAGYDGRADLRNRHNGLFGQNRNEWVDEEGLRGLRMTTAKYEAEHPQFGSMAVATDWPDTTYLAHWERAGWWDDLQAFWDDFSRDGRLPDQPVSDPSPNNQTDVGSLGLVARVAPGQSVTLPFVLAWHFPNLTNYWNGEEAVKGKRIGNFYTTRAADAWEAARQAVAALSEQEERTRRFHQTLFESTLPAHVLDAVSSQASIIRTTTCLWTSDGRFNAFEGCSDNAGCCPMNCTHVWNYEQSLAYLFPALERTMRETDFGHNTRPDGDMAFRTLLPLVEDTLWGFKPAADGQMGTVLKLYREWQLSGDEAFLRRLWPDAKRALEYAWRGWDADRDGVMEGEQHNTYDIEFYGPNTMMGTLYLAALEAGARMAEALGDAELAQSYRDVAQRGSEKYDRELWNGEFYVQTVVPPSAADGSQTLGAGHPPSVQAGESEPRYQYGPGCLSDQMLGQWFAHVVGLGRALPEARVRQTMQSIFRHNFRHDLSAHASCQRTYALNDEAGLLLCSWPNGGRPAYPFPYADEVWTGIEYQVAAHLIYEGLLREGLEIVHAVRRRHDGERRNPWDEFECGHHYARAMASWSVLLALSGYQYSAPTQTLRFAPCVETDDFRCLFTAGNAWGSNSQMIEGGHRSYSVEVRHGTLTLSCLALGGAAPQQVTVRIGDREVDAAIEPQEGGWMLRLAHPVPISTGEQLTVTAGA